MDDLSAEYPLVPETNIPSRENPLYQLGMELFFTKSLSGNMDVACVSCHHPFLAGGDGLSLPVGESPYDEDLLGPGRWHNWQASLDPKADGAPNVPRHSPTTFNAALYYRTMFYDGRIFVLDEAYKQGGKGQAHRTPDSNLWQQDPDAGNDLLETQARFPVVAADEMQSFKFAKTRTHDQVRVELLERLKGRTGELEKNRWLAMFQKAFNQPQGTADQLMTFENIQTALSYYQSTQIFVDNDWYAFLEGDSDRLSDQQVRGALLFFKSAEDGGAGCVSCHQPPTFTDEMFHNIAMPQFGRGKQANGEDFGRRGVTQKESDRFAFRTPALLNVAKSAPYGHSGAFTNLKDVIRHHLSPAASLEQFDFSFSNNGQLKHVAERYGNAADLSLDALEHLRQQQRAGESRLQTVKQVKQADVDALYAFLVALTDPCLQSQSCLSAWVPDEQKEAPDENRLKAKFSEHLAPPKPILSGDAQAVKTVTKADVTLADSSLGLENDRCAVSSPEQNNGGFVFDEVALSAGLKAKHKISWDLYNLDNVQRMLFSGGIAAGDLDGDCWVDIYLPTGDQAPDVLYRNNADGTFSDVSSQWGIAGIELSNGATMVDIDGDNDLDLITSNIIHPEMSSVAGAIKGDDYAQIPTVYLNKAGQAFRVEPDSGIFAKFTSWSFAFADYDNDGDLDALTTHWRGPGLGGGIPNHLWKNESDATGLTFVPEDKAADLVNMVGKSDFTFTGNFSDFDADGDMDILMAADFESSQIYKNQGNGRFKKRTLDSEISDKNGMGSAIADYDNDGDLDWFVSSVWDPNGIAEGTWGVTGNRLYSNEGGRFKDTTSIAGVDKGFWAWGACFADFNNDKWPDLFHVNGFQLDTALAKHFGHPRAYMKLKRSVSEFEETSSRLFISNQDGTFDEQSGGWNITDTKAGRGVVCFDYDRDGDVDILISNHQDRPLLYRNNSRSMPDTHFININLQGLGKNTQAIGAKVYVTADGVTQLQEVRAGGGFVSSAPSELHFGLGKAEVVDEIKVVWPGSEQHSSLYQNVRADQFVQIMQNQQALLATQ